LFACKPYHTLIGEHLFSAFSEANIGSTYNALLWAAPLLAWKSEDFLSNPREGREVECVAVSNRDCLGVQSTAHVRRACSFEKDEVLFRVPYRSTFFILANYSIVYPFLGYSCGPDKHVVFFRFFLKNIRIFNKCFNFKIVEI
jgi:hypothetical protein